MTSEQSDLEWNNERIEATTNLFTFIESPGHLDCRNLNQLNHFRILQNDWSESNMGPNGSLFIVFHNLIEVLCNKC